MWALGDLTLGLREVLLGLLVLVVLYTGFLIFRMRRLKAVPAAGQAMPSAVAQADQSDEVEVPEAPRLAASRPALVEPESVINAADYHYLQGEVGMLREEVDTLRGELAALRSDMQHELAQMRATQSVSPIYGDAMQMALSGCDALLISERCGIARGEAELVLALANSQRER